MEANTNNSNNSTTVCWGQIAKPIESVNFATIVKNQKEEKLIQTKQRLKEQQLEKALEEQAKIEDDWDIIDMEAFDANLQPEVLAFLKFEEEEFAAADELNGYESDSLIDEMLQSNLKSFDNNSNYMKHYVTDIREKFYQKELEEDEFVYDKRDIPKCSHTVDRETEHYADLCGVRNADKMMCFPAGFDTGDDDGFNMKLSNRVFNQLKNHSRKNHKKNDRVRDRKFNVGTSETVVDGRTRLLLYEFIDNNILKQINSIVATGKEAVILHANSNPTFVGYYHIPQIMPKECAVKIFKTSLNDFKQRDRYKIYDYRFKYHFGVSFSRQNNMAIINMWAEREMLNLKLMRNVGINCPEVVILKNHILVMSFIGNNKRAAPKLNDAILTSAEWTAAYDEVVNVMCKLYNEAKLVHADLNENNILWHDGKCWFINVAQSVERQHPLALSFLMQDCINIITFFGKKGVRRCHTKAKLFKHILTSYRNNKRCHKIGHTCKSR